MDVGAHAVADRGGGGAAAQEAGRSVREALIRLGHVPLTDAQGAHQQLGGLPQVLHRHLPVTA